PTYEEAGQDYPFPYVRWTERRNMQEFLRLVAAGLVRPERLTTHRFPIERAAEAYELVTGKTQTQFAGVLLQYNPGEPRGEARAISRPRYCSPKCLPVAM